MPLEATLICCDNSDFMRNGDYLPTRLLAQQETVSLLANVKTQSNQESEVGVLTMAGKRVQVLVTPTRDLGKLMTNMTSVKPEGTCNFIAGIKIAQLALKNRSNKSQRQRIILFVGSPLNDQNMDEWIKLGKSLKKNSVAVDVINFGDENSNNENCEKLAAFVNAVNNSDNSKLVNVPPGPHNLSDMVLSTLHEGGEGASSSGIGASSSGGASAAEMYGGVDPNMDPELAMVLRASMEEENERQRKIAESQSLAAQASSASSATSQDIEMNDDEAILAAAIAMSMSVDQGDTEMSDAKMPAAAKENVAQGSNDDVNAALRDPDFLNSLLDSLPGVDKSEIDVNQLMESINSDDKKGKDKPEDKKTDKDKK